MRIRDRPGKMQSTGDICMKTKEGEQPERMWSNQVSCGSGNPKKFSFDYYFDY